MCNKRRYLSEEACQQEIGRKKLNFKLTFYRCPECSVWASVYHLTHASRTRFPRRGKRAVRYA